MDEILKEKVIDRLNFSQETLEKEYRFIISDTENERHLFDFINLIGDVEASSFLKNAYYIYKYTRKVHVESIDLVESLSEILYIIFRGTHLFIDNDKQYGSYVEDAKINLKRYRSSITNDLSLLFFNAVNSNRILIEKGVEDNAKMLNETKEYYDDLKGKFIKSGIHSFASKYSKIANDESCAKALWLGVSCVLAVLIVCVVAIFSANLMNIEYKTYLNLLYSFAERLPVIIILLVFFVWISKRYAISRDKEIVYRHLAMTLHVFNAFYKTAEPDHKSLVLMEAAKTLFPAPTDNKSGDASDNAKMLDVLKLLMNSSVSKKVE